MSYYSKQIKHYRRSTDFTTNIGEAMYIIWIKDFFKQTSMKKGQKKHILDYNTEKFSIIIKDDINMFLSTQILMQTEKNVVLQVNFVNDIKKIRVELKWHIEGNEQVILQHS